MPKSTDMKQRRVKEGQKDETMEEKDRKNMDRKEKYI